MEVLTAIASVDGGLDKILLMLGVLGAHHGFDAMLVYADRERLQYVVDERQRLWPAPDPR